MATIPTILQIPSGYKSGYYGIVYNVLPQSNSKVFYYQKSGNATRVNKDGIIETNGSNLPRLDYTNSTCPSLLLEPQSTNKCKFSEYFGYAPVSGAWGATGVTPTGSFSTAPNGATTSTKLTRTSLTSTSRLEAPVLMTGGNVTETNTASIYVKNIDSTHFLFRMEMGVISSNYVDASFNFSTQELILESSSGYTLKGLKVDVLADGWFRLSMTYQNTNYNQDKFQIAPSNSANRNTVTANTSVEIWGGQFELLDYASSYIATSNNNVTRNFDSLFSTTLTSEMSGSKSSFFIDVLAFKETSTISLTTGNITGISINFDPGVNQIAIYGSGLLYFIPVDYSQRIKIGISFENNNFKIYYNGVLSAIDTSVAYPTTLNNIKFSDPTNNLKFQGNLYDLRFYNNVILTEAELIELTTI